MIIYSSIADNWSWYCWPIPIPGVPMPHAVAGVACGLFSRTKRDSGDIDQYQILTDINVSSSLIPRPIPSFSMFHTENLGMGLGMRLCKIHIPVILQSDAGN